VEGRLPLMAMVTVLQNGDSVDVEVIGSDRKGYFVGDFSVRRGDLSIGECSYVSQFQRACVELQSTTVASR
jgi:hypothetical protein